MKKINLEELPLYIQAIEVHLAEAKENLRKNQKLKLKEQIMEDLLEQYRSILELVNPNNPINAVSEKEINEKYALNLKKYSNSTQKEIIKKLTLTEYKAEAYKFASDWFGVERAKMSSRLISIQKLRIHTSRAKQAGNRKNDAIDDVRLLECLNDVANGDPKSLQNKDYLRFARKVKEKYKTQHFIRKPRQTKQSKKLSQEMQLVDLELDKSEEWKESRLRKFFEDKTGIKPTTKIKTFTT